MITTYLVVVNMAALVTVVNINETRTATNSTPPIFKGALKMANTGGSVVLPFVMPAAFLKDTLPVVLPSAGWPINHQQKINPFYGPGLSLSWGNLTTLPKYPPGFEVVYDRVSIENTPLDQLCVDARCVDLDSPK